LALCVLSPTILANGALMASDTAIGLFLLAGLFGRTGGLPVDQFIEVAETDDPVAHFDAQFHSAAQQLTAMPCMGSHGFPWLINPGHTAIPSNTKLSR